MCNVHFHAWKWFIHVMLAGLSVSRLLSWVLCWVHTWCEVHWWCHQGSYYQRPHLLQPEVCSCECPIMSVCCCLPVWPSVVVWCGGGHASCNTESIINAQDWMWCYHIAGNFGDLVNGVKIAKLKTHQFKLNAFLSMILSIQIAKFKFHQYQLRAISPNLTLTKNYPLYDTL